MHEMRRRSRRGAGWAPGAAAALALLAGTVTGCSGGHPAHGGRGTAPAPAWNARPASVAALGDSITRGFDTCSLLSDCADASWATGTRAAVDSVARRLTGSSADRRWNFAVSGARMADLPGQAERAAAVRPGLVTVLMGANDACARTVADMTPVAAFRTRFTAAMDTLHRRAPGTEVYVASIPDLMQLWSVGRTNVWGRQVWKLGICPSMLDRAGGTSAADTARRAAVRARVVAYNAVLDEVCGRLPRCRYDGGAVFRQPFTTAELSPWDNFHPSTLGQAELARLAYRGVTRS